MTGIDRKVFSRAFCSCWDHENHQRIGGDMAEWSLWQSYYLYYFTSSCTLKSYDHKSFQNVLWSHDSGHIVCLLKFPHYLYFNPIVHFDVVDQMFKCTRNYFLLGALITSTIGFLIRGLQDHLNNSVNSAQSF